MSSIGEPQERMLDKPYACPLYGTRTRSTWARSGHHGVTELTDFLPIANYHENLASIALFRLELQRGYLLYSSLLLAVVQLPFSFLCVS